LWSDYKNLLVVKVSQFLKNCSYNCSKKHVNNHKVILMVIWEFPHINWVKVNTDGVVRGCSSFSACADIFYCNRSEYIGSFSSFLRVQKYLYVEIMWVILAIDLAWSKNFRCIWLECDSSLLCQTFSSFNLIPWSLRGRWRKCVKICKEVEFKVSLIFREENHYADKLTLLGLENKLYFKWYDRFTCCY